MSALPTNGKFPQGIVLPKRAIIYSRVSTDEQAATGTGLDGQEAESLAYADSIGATVVARFREDYTGTTLNRPDLTQARAMLQAGQADILIAHRPDRLDRSEWGINLMLLLQELKSLGTELHYSQQRRHIDLNNPAEALMQSIFGWQAGEDRSAIVKRLEAGRIEKVKQGSVMVFNNPPYGYDETKEELEGGRTHYRLIINEEEAAIVRKIFHWTIYGDEIGRLLGALAIANKLTEMNVLTKSDKDPACNHKKMGRGQWNRGTVYSMLNNRVYTGEWQYGKRGQEPLTVEVPAIISRELFALAQSKTKGRSNNTKNRNYFLSGRIRCGCCGYKMHGISIGERYHYYRCPSKTIKLLRKCDNENFNASKVDGAIWNWLTEMFTDPTGEAIYKGLLGYRELTEKQSKPLEQELEEAKKTVKQLERQLETMYRDFQAASSEWLKKRIEGDMTILEGQLSGAQAIIERLTEQLRQQTVTPEEEVRLLDFAAKMRDNWDAISRDIESKQAILNRFNIQVELKLVDGKKTAIVTGKLIPDEKLFVVETMTTWPH